jgi:hypothetical protein
MSTDVVATRVANASFGGLWVGGRVTVTTKQIEFHPNGVNRALHVGTLDVEIPLPDIEKVEVLPGFVTRIIAITTARQILRLRCYRAEAFARQVTDLVPGKKG